MRLGADTDQLERLARTVDGGAQQLTRLSHGLTSIIRTVEWSGPDADAFRSTWHGQHEAVLRHTSGALSAVAEELQRQAADQRRTSDDGAAGSPPAPVPGSSEAPATGVNAGLLTGGYATTREGIEGELTRLRAELEALRAGDGGNWLSERLGDINPFARSVGETEADLERQIAELDGLLGASSARGPDGQRLDRQFLSFDATPGDHRLVEVIGDLGTADRVVIHIPGMNTDLGEYRNGGHSSATSLFGAANRATTDNVVVISFMDYNVPDDVLEAANGRGADSGVEPLQGLVADLHRAGYATDELSVVAHSYGSVVAGHTMQDGLDVGRVVTLGSPGMAGGANDRSELGSPGVELYSGAADSDVVAYLPAHGEDPSAQGFGANRFSTDGASGHSEYFDEGTESLTNVARISVGLEPLDD